jgi:very-short-patch-repair endonuclease
VIHDSVAQGTKNVLLRTRTWIIGREIGVLASRGTLGGDARAVRIDALLRRQDGVISLYQATAAGLTARAVHRRVASGRWRRLHPRVFHCTGGELSDTGRVWAAALWARPRAAVTGLAAAWWHGLVADCPDVVEVTVARTRQPGGRPGVRVRRRDLADADLVLSQFLLVSDVPLTVLEAAVQLDADGPEFLDRALQRRVRFEALSRAHHRNLGRQGSPAAAALLGAAADGAASVAERRLVRLLRAAGLTGWRLGYAVSGYLLDLAFPAARVAIEVDGWAWHSTADRFRADRRRQNALILAGWTVLRFTWDDLVHRPDAVLAQIYAALTAPTRRA